MLISSIDLQSGNAVQLRQGKVRVLDAGDPRPIAQRFDITGEIAVIDLDAALGTGSNESTIRDLLRIARCRVGGGIRSLDAARNWLDAGAQKIILGTAATPELLSQLPRSRVMAALDSWNNDIVTHGWTTKTGASVLDRIRELRPFVSGFLITFVEIEGTMGGFDIERCEPLIEAAGDARITFAGGITTPAQIAALDRLGADAQVGMALYTDALDPIEPLIATLISDRPDGLWPTITTDERGVALGLAYSNAESLRAAHRERRGIYWSRTRGLWRKGDTSGDTQELLRIDADCDRDCLRFTVRQAGFGNCHLRTRTCFGDDPGLGASERRLMSALSSGDPSSYTTRLSRDSSLLRAKLIEEANELMDAREHSHIAAEAADVIYFTLARLASAGVSLESVERELAHRALKLSRRPGHAKPLPEAGAGVG
jgi:phosphoribosyl-ATP pyrophosphohydrolase